MPIKIDIFMSEICGSYYELRENVERALQELGIAAEVNYETIYYEDAVTRSISGSPSLWINGKDAFEGGNSPGLT
jgi:Thioredoxin domain